MSECLAQDRQIRVLGGKPSPRSAQLAPASRVSYTRTRPSGVTRSRSATSGITYALSASLRVDDEREAEVGGKSRVRSDVDPALARVVRAVDAAVELHEQPLRPGRGAMHVVHAEGEGVLPRVLGQVAGHQALVPVAPGPTAVVREPDADRRDAHRQLAGIARPGRDRVQAHASGAGSPLGSRRLLPERLVELPRRPAVTALEEHAGIAARVEMVVLDPRNDRPEPDQRLLLAFREREALGLLPLSGGIVGDEDLRPVEGRGHAGEVAAAPAVAHRELDRLAGERAGADVEGPPLSPWSANRPFLVPTRSSVIFEVNLR